MKGKDMVKEEPRKVEHWEVKHAMFLGGHEIVFAEDELDKENTYFIGDCSYDNPFGLGTYSNCIGTADYLEAVFEYTQRVQNQIKLIRQERSERGVSDEPLTMNECISGGLGENIEGKLVVIRPIVMHRDRRTADYQYFFADGGNGCRADAIGHAVFGQNLYTGKRARWERSDILGIADPDKLPQWAKIKLEILLKEKQPQSRPKTKSAIER